MTEVFRFQDLIITRGPDGTETYRHPLSAEVVQFNPQRDPFYQLFLRLRKLADVNGLQLEPDLARACMHADAMEDDLEVILEELENLQNSKEEF